MGDRVRPLLEYQYDNGQNTAGESLSFIDNYFNNADGKQHVTDPHPVSYYLWGAGGAIYYTSANPQGLQAAITIPDSSFKSESVAPGTAVVNPAGSEWTFTGNAGVYAPAPPTDAITDQTLGSTVTAAVDTLAGEKFTVGDADLTLYQVGVWADPGQTGSHTLRIINAAEHTQITEVTFNLTNATTGGFQYAPTELRRRRCRVVPAHAGRRADRERDADRADPRRRCARDTDPRQRHAELQQQDRHAQRSDDGWIDWNILVPATGDYDVIATTTGGGSARLSADDAVTLATASAGSPLQGRVLLTAGLHTIKIQAPAGGVTVSGVNVHRRGGAAAEASRPLIVATTTSTHRQTQ